MANLEHDNLSTSQVHEPKHITSAAVGDHGKVITPSSSATGTSVLTQLSEDEITAVIDYLTVRIPDISTADSVWIAAPKAGTIISWSTTLQDVITGSDENLHLEIGGVNVTDSDITIAVSGSAAGVVDTASPTANNAVSANQAIEVITSGNSTGPAAAWCVIGIQRS